MRTPFEIARMLGWPEGKTPPPGTCLHPGLDEALACPTCATHVRREVDRATRPRLVIRKGSGGWSWWIVRPDGRPTDSSFDRGFHSWHRTHAEALAVGLAALEHAHLPTAGSPA